MGSHYIIFNINNISLDSKAVWLRLRDGRKLKIQQFGSSLRRAAAEERTSENSGLPWGVERARAPMVEVARFWLEYSHNLSYTILSIL